MTSMDISQSQTKLLRFPSLISRNSSNTFLEDNQHHDLRYVSLKDVMLNCPTPTYCPTNVVAGTDINASNIGIKNELVKRAASAYVQSTAILLTQNQNYFVRFWRNVRSRAQSYCTHRLVIDASGCCLQSFCRFVARTVECMWNRVRNFNG